MTKKRYHVRDDVTRINGAPVPDDRVVRLTDREAVFDLSLGRIVEEGAARKTRKEKSAPADEAVGSETPGDS